jgi:hypothetical protein
MVDTDDITVLLITLKMRNNYGLAKSKWLLTLDQIRQLPQHT